MELDGGSKKKRPSEDGDEEEQEEARGRGAVLACSWCGAQFSERDAVRLDGVAPLAWPERQGRYESEDCARRAVTFAHRDHRELPVVMAYLRKREAARLARGAEFAEGGGGAIAVGLSPAFRAALGRPRSSHDRGGEDGSEDGMEM